MHKQIKELQSVQKDFLLDLQLLLGFSTSVANTDGTVGIQTGYLKGIITGVNVGSIDVKIVSKHNITTDVWSRSRL